MLRWVHVKPVNIAHLVHIRRIFRNLELPEPVGPQTIPLPNPTHRRKPQPYTLRHRSQRPVRCLPVRWGQCQFHNLTHLPVRNRRRPRRPCRFIQKTINPFLHKTPLPAIHRVLRLTRPAYNLHCATPVGSLEDDPRPPNMLVLRTRITGNRIQTAAVCAAYRIKDTFSHDEISFACKSAPCPADSHI